MQFLRECMPGRIDDNIRQIVSIAEYSRQTLHAVRTEIGLDYDCLTRGILHFYTDQREFDKSLAAAALMRKLGCPRNTISVDEIIRLEPALAGMRDKIVGGDFTTTDESGDVYKFTCGLAAKASEAGVQFRFNATVTRLLSEASGARTQITGVEVIDADGRHQTLQADAFVVALGSFSAPITETAGHQSDDLTQAKAIPPLTRLSMRKLHRPCR